MKAYKVFVIFHNEINLKYFDPSVLNNVVFVNVNPFNRNRYPEVNVINLYEIPGFIPLGKWYTESEVIYNIYKSPDLMAGVGYVGFIHYDIDFTPFNETALQSALNGYDLINFQPLRLEDDYGQNILMDPDKPDTLTGEGKNCYLSIFDDFNSFYGTDHNPMSLMKEQINLCSCFLMSRQLFEEMMPFACRIIESGKLDSYDTGHRYRIQGGFMERYYGVWGLLKAGRTLNYPLKHEFVQTIRQLPYIQRLKRKVAAFLKFNKGQAS